MKNGEKPKERDKKEILNTILKHLDLEIDEKGEYTAIREMRKHIAWYTKGMKNSSEIRNSINTSTSKAELVKAITEYFK